MRRVILSLPRASATCGRLMCTDRGSARAAAFFPQHEAGGSPPVVYTAVNGHSSIKSASNSFAKQDIPSAARNVDARSEPSLAESDIGPAGAFGNANSDHTLSVALSQEEALEPISSLGSVQGAPPSSKAGSGTAAEVNPAKNEETYLHGTDSSVEHESSESMKELEGSARKLTEVPLHAQLQAMISRQRLFDAASTFRSALRHEDPNIVTPRALKQIIPVLARLGWINLMQKTFVHIMDHDVFLPTAVFNNGLSMIARYGDVQMIERVIDYMWSRESLSHPNAVTYNNLIAAYFSHDDIDKGYAVLQSMKARMIYPTFGTYHTLILGCIRRNAPRRAYETLLAVEQQRFHMSALVIGQLMVSCADDDEIDTLSLLISRFEDAMPRYAVELERLAEQRQMYHVSKGANRSFSDRAALRGEPKLELGGIMSVLRAAYRASRPDIAERAMLWYDDWYPGLQIPSAAWYCLIGAYGASTDFSSALMAVSRMRLAGHQPALKDLHEPLIKSLSTDLQKVDDLYYNLLDKLNRKNPAEHWDQGNVQVASAKSGQSSGGAEEEEPRLENPAENDGSLSSASLDADSTQPSLLSNAEKAPQASLGEVLLSRRGREAKSSERSDEVESRKMQNYDVGIEEMNCIIAACSLAGDLDRAFQTYDEIQKYSLPRNTDTFNALLMGCVTDRHVQGGRRIVEEMENVGVPFNFETVNLAVRLHVRAGELGEARQILEKATDKGIPLSSNAIQTVVRRLMRLGRLADVRVLLEIAKKNGILPIAAVSRVDGPYVKDLRLLEGSLESVDRVATTELVD